MTLLIAPVAGVLCFFVIWIAFRLRWSRLIVTMMCAVIIGASMAAYFADPVTGQAACPLAGLVLGSVLGAGIGWTTHGAVSEAIRLNCVCPPSSS